MASKPPQRRPATGQAKPSTDYSFKVIMLGDSTVGKTSLLSKYTDGKLSKLATAPTVGVDLAKKQLHVDGYNVKLLIWDTAGQERFRTITRSFYRDAQAVCLCYDITSDTSFAGIRSWLREIADQSPDCDIMLLGNKKDLEDDRRIASAAGAAVAKDLGVPFFETSAVTGEGIEEAFAALAKVLLRRVVPAAGSATPGKTETVATTVGPKHWESKAESLDLSAKAPVSPETSGCWC